MNTVERILARGAAYLARRFTVLPSRGLSRPVAPAPGRKYLLYVHVPFCETLCPYCSFNRIEFAEPVATAYFRALSREIDMYAARGYDFGALYIGGGTPTVMPEEIAALIARVRKQWGVRQVSVETTPSHLTPRILGILKDAGVKRLSVGVQSFDDAILASIERLERHGTGEQIQSRLHAAKGMFQTLNVDLIFNFPGQTREMLLRDIETVNALAVDQVTYYPLMLTTARKRRLAATTGALDPRREKQYYRLIHNSLSAAYTQRSIWCFGRAEGMIDEYIMDHEEYVAAGPGSFGYIGGRMYVNLFSVDKYIRAVNGGDAPIAANRLFSKKERIKRDFLFTLMGCSLDCRAFTRKHGTGALVRMLPELLGLLSIGAITHGNGKIRLTRKGMYHWIILMRSLFTEIGNLRERSSPRAARSTGMRGAFGRSGAAASASRAAASAIRDCAAAAV